MILAVDTSTDELLVVVVDGTVIAAQEARPGVRPEAELDGAIQAAVRAAGGFPAVDRLAVVTGPGPYTGLRTGLAMAAGVAFARHLPVVPLTSLLVAAHRAEGSHGRVLAVVAAGRDNFYAQQFSAVGDHRHPVGPVEAVALAALTGVATEAALPIGAAPGVLARIGDLPRGLARPGRQGGAALAAATAQAAETGLALAYDELRGQYE